MTSNDPNSSKFHVSKILTNSIYLLITNIGSLIVLSIVLFLFLDFLYDSIKERFLELIQHENIKLYMDSFMQQEYVRAFMNSYNSTLRQMGTEPPSPVAFIFFSFLLPVAVIRLLFASNPPQGSLIERVLYKYKLITSPGFIISSFRYVCAFIGQLFLLFFVPFVLEVIIFACFRILESIWFLGLLLLFVLGHIYFLFRFTAVFQLAYVSISVDNLGAWESLKRGYSMSSPSWIKISTIFLIVLPLILSIVIGLLIILSPDLEIDYLGVLASNHLVNFIYVTFSAILSAVCYRELKGVNRPGNP